jgi:predicted RNA-binding protein YlxR (DUF448 family)
MTHPRHVPLRRCVACRDAQPKRALVRLVRAEGTWRLDLAQRAGGRGTSLCRACAHAAVAAAARGGATTGDDAARLKGFRRAFRQDAAAVTALLVPIASTLDPTPTDAPTGARVAEPDARPRPNGGMHG